MTEHPITPHPITPHPITPHPITPALARRRKAVQRPTAAVAITLALAAAAWVVAVRRMPGMDMGVATDLGSFGSFVAVWVPMMAAMMFPGAAPAVAERASAGWSAVARFLATYLAGWTLVGLVVFAGHQPHGTRAAGIAVIAAGIYELTPLKRHFRQQCLERVGTGSRYTLGCIGSSIGLMLILVVLGPMSLTWMAVLTVVVVAQKLLPVKARIDVPVALVIVGLGVLIVLAPGSVPALKTPM